MLADGAMEWVLTPEWDVEQVTVSADGRRLLWTLNESGRSQLHLRDNEQASLRVSGLPIGVIEYMKLSPDGQTLALRINSATAPAEVYILTLGAVGVVSTPHLRRLTFGMLGGLDPARDQFADDDSSRDPGGADDGDHVTKVRSECSSSHASAAAYPLGTSSRVTWNEP